MQRSAVFLYVQDMGTRDFSAAKFLKDALVDENNVGVDPLIVAVHAAVLDSGFVGFDSVSRTRIDGLRWPGESSAMSVSYTFPQLLDNIEDVSESSIVLNFLKLDDFVRVSGSVAKNISLRKIYYLSLYRSTYASDVDLLKGNCLQDGMMSKIDDLWRTVKNSLVLPLSIDLSDKTAVPLPSRFMSLQQDSKLRISERLPPTDVARMGFACPKIRSSCSNNDLWKRKFVEKFGNLEEAHGVANWKSRYVWDWKLKMKQNKKQQQNNFVDLIGL